MMWIFRHRLLAAFIALEGAREATCHAIPRAAILKRADSECSAVNGCEPCRRIAEDISLFSEEDDVEIDQLFGAPLAEQCLESVPFKKAEALQTVRSLRRFAEFIPNQAFLKDVEFAASKHFEPVDVQHDLGLIEQALTSDENPYDNEYQFEKDLQIIFDRTNDTHNIFDGHLSTGVFRWVREEEAALVSVSLDGNAPKVYPADDLLIHGQQTPYVVEIEGQDVQAWFAKENTRNIYRYDRHAAYNLIFRPPEVVEFDPDTGWMISPDAYPGASIAISFSNDSTIDYDSYAIARSGTGWAGVHGPESAYDAFVRSRDDDNDNDLSTESIGSETEPSFKSENVHPAALDKRRSGSRSKVETSRLRRRRPTSKREKHPVPRMARPLRTVFDRGRLSDGRIGGYLMDLDARADQEIAVLALGAFKDLANKLQRDVTNFVRECDAANVRRLIIDVRWNHGGGTSTLWEVFAALFPSLRPKDIVRFRRHQAADLVGSRISGVPGAVERSHFLHYTDFTDQYGRHWLDWASFQSPTPILGGDSYSPPSLNPSTIVGRIQSAEIFTGINVAILSDGICSSACAALINWLTDETLIQGVTVVTVGGLPESGAMVSTSGSLGAEQLTMDNLLELIDLVARRIPAADYRNWMPEEPDIRFSLATINVLDSMRDFVDTTPMQFTPIGSHCRLWYTLDHLQSSSALYLDVYDVVWGGDPGRNAELRARKCVPGSVQDHVRS